MSDTPFVLLVEVAPGGECFVHVPALPGLCFRARDPDEVESLAPGRIAEYSRWILTEGLVDLTPEAAALVHHAQTGGLSGIRVVEAERRDGSPLWISGSPAALFDHDRRPLDDTAVAAHLRVVGRVVHRIRAIVAVLSQDQLEHKPSVGRRSVNETLTHMGNCVWWYCSRIDDVLPEPVEISEEAPMARIERLLEVAGEYLLAVPLQARMIVNVPTRFLTKDPREAWTHAKVCRREAEHMWEHLQKFPQAVAIARGNDEPAEDSR